MSKKIKKCGKCLTFLSVTICFKNWCTFFKTALKLYVYTNTLCVHNVHNKVHNSTLADGGGREIVYETGSLILLSSLI